MKHLKVTPQRAVSEQTAKAVLASISPNTERAYRSAVKGVEAWLNGRALTDALLADYIAELFYEGDKSPSMVSQIVAAVSWRMGDACPSGEITTKTLAGIRREGAKKGRKQVKGLSYDDVCDSA